MVSHKFYILDDTGMPCRQLTAEAWPEVMTPQGEWVMMYDAFRFDHEARPVNEDEFQGAVAKYLKSDVLDVW